APGVDRAAITGRFPGLGPLSPVCVDFLQPIQFGSELLDALVLLPAIRCRLICFRAERQNQCCLWSKRTIGICVDKLLKYCSHMLPVGRSRPQNIAQAQME